MLRYICDFCNKPIENERWYRIDIFISDNPMPQSTKNMSSLGSKDCCEACFQKRIESEM